MEWRFTSNKEHEGNRAKRNLTQNGRKENVRAEKVTAYGNEAKKEALWEDGSGKKGKKVAKRGKHT